MIGKHEADGRKADLARIHIAKKSLGLDEPTYRDIIRMVGGCASAADLNATGRAKVLRHFAKLGFKGGQKYRGRPHNIDRSAQLKKIEALLTVGGKSWAYADSMAARICKVDRIAWVPAAQLYKIITALRKQAEREGWDLSGE